MEWGLHCIVMCCRCFANNKVWLCNNECVLMPNACICSMTSICVCIVYTIFWDLLRILWYCYLNFHSVSNVSETSENKIKVHNRYHSLFCFLKCCLTQHLVRGTVASRVAPPSGGMQKGTVQTATLTTLLIVTLMDYILSFVLIIL